MKILIIEDQDWKYEKLVKAIKASIEGGVIITRATNVVDAKRNLNDIKYDKIICDMRFPLREGYRPEQTSGAAVILFKQKLRCINKKTDLIVVSADAESAKETLIGCNIKDIICIHCDASTYVQDKIKSFITGEKESE